MTAVTTASPVDFTLHGDYAPPPGAYRRERDLTTLVYPIDDRVTDDASGTFTAEPGRYHLYVCHYCPWAQRPLIALKLRGLDGVVTWSAVDPVRDGRGWAFREGDGHDADPVNGFAFLREAYLATDPTFDGHISVPALWDRSTGRLVSNHYPTLTADLETEFRAFADPAIELYPAARRDEIDACNADILRDVAGATYGAISARTQQRYDTIIANTERALASYDSLLADRRYLLGDALTDADLLLYVNLVRFDLIGVRLARFARRLVDYPNLWAYARSLYQQPAFGSTTDFEHIRRGNFRTPLGGPNRILAPLPFADWHAAHRR